MPEQNCGIVTGIGASCSDLRRSGGIKRRFWLGNIDDLRRKFSETSAIVTDIALNTYRTLYEVEGRKGFADFTITATVGDGGVGYFRQQLIFRPVITDITDDAFMESLLNANLFAVVETNNDEFLILGYNQGLALPQGDGATITSARLTTEAPSITITLEGAEKGMPRRFLRNNSYEDTLAFLNAATA